MWRGGGAPPYQTFQKKKWWGEEIVSVQTEEMKIVSAVFITSVSFPLFQICFGNFQLLDDGVGVYAMSLRTSKKYRVGQGGKGSLSWSWWGGLPLAWS